MQAEGQHVSFGPAVNSEIPYLSEGDGAVGSRSLAKGMWIVTNQADGPPQVSPDESQDELRRIAEVYALRSRELSDAVAGLGALLITGKPFGCANRTIKIRRVLCDEAAYRFFAFLSLAEGRRSAGASTGSEMPQKTPNAE
jgi:hypothetical protein